MTSAKFACPDCQRSLQIGANGEGTCCGNRVSTEHGITNWLGSEAHTFSVDRDESSAKALVQHLMGVATSPHAPAIPISATDAASLAQSSGLSAIDIATLTQLTQLVQLCNNCLEYALPPSLRSDTPTSSFVLRSVNVRSGDELLDVGCSAGRYLVEFANSGSGLTGLDIDGFALRVAKHSWLFTQHSAPPTLLLADALRMPFLPATFSHVTCWVVLAFLPIRRALQQMRRVLRPGGKLVFTVEGPGFIHELSDKTAPTLMPRLTEVRRHLAHKSMEWGVDWQSHPIFRRLSGVTVYSPATLSRLLKSAGFSVDSVEVLSSYKSLPRLIGVTASVHV